MQQVFLSYAHEDGRSMAAVRDAVARAGFDVWTDAHLQPGTESWTRAIQAAIDDAVAVVVVLSPAAKRSKWVNREVHYALEQGVPVIPVLAEGTARTSVPFAIIDVQLVDIRDGIGLDALTDTLHGRSPESPPAPISTLVPPRPEPTRPPADSVDRFLREREAVARAE